MQFYACNAILLCNAMIYGQKILKMQSMLIANFSIFFCKCQDCSFYEGSLRLASESMSIPMKPGEKKQK